MAEHPIPSSETVFPKDTAVLGAEVREDLRRKQALLSAACRCLEDERSYRFFDTLASLARLAPETKALYLDFLEAVGGYQEHELVAIRRLIMGEGAAAFKDLVDVVRDIRVQHEIQAMVRRTNGGGPAAAGGAVGKPAQMGADGHR